MSFRRTFRLRYTAQARRDVKAILRYTEETWGQRQADAYGGKLDRAFMSIGANPGCGHRHRSMPPSHRVQLVGSHMVVYRIEDEVVIISRVLHQRMDAGRHV